MSKLKLFILLLILVGAFVARLYQFQRPIADWHSWRQADTSAVSRNFIREGFNILHPKFDDLSMGVSLLDNPQGNRFVEFPFYNIAQAGLYKVFGHFTLEEWGRIVTILSQEISIIFIFLIVQMFTNSRAGLFASAFFAFIPFNVYYGRVVLPDSSMVAALMSSFYLFARFAATKKNKFWIASLILLTCALLLKPYALFFTLPFLAVAFQSFKFKLVKRVDLWIFAIIAILPFVWWRWWMSHYPEGIPQSNWLFNGTNIRFKGAFFQWLFADRISRLILGYFGLPFVIVGIIARQKKEALIYWSFLFSSLIYMVVMATGNVQHDYYQILIIPAISIFFGKGLDFLLGLSKELINKTSLYITLGVSIALMMAFSWFIVRDYYNLQHVHVYEVGVLADKILPKNVKVVAPYGGDTTFLYYVNRKGWPVVDRPFEDLVKAGARYIVFADPTPDELHLSTLYPVFSKGENYVIFDLFHPLTPGKY